MYVTPSVPSRPYIAASVTSSKALVASSNTITEILLLLYSTRANANLCCSPRDNTCADKLSYHVHVMMHVRTFISYITDMKHGMHNSGYVCTDSVVEAMYV